MPNSCTGTREVLNQGTDAGSGRACSAVEQRENAGLCPTRRVRIKKLRATRELMLGAAVHILSLDSSTTFVSKYFVVVNTGLLMIAID